MIKFQEITTINVLNLPKFAVDEIAKLSDKNLILHTTDSDSEEMTIKRIGSADATLGSWNTTITKNVLDHCPNLKYIGICGTSLTNVDVTDAEARGIIVKNVTDYGDEATAEFIFAQLLNLYRGLGKYHLDEIPRELNGKTIGIVGLGAVGQQVARLALGFDMKVLYTSKSPKTEWGSKGLKFTNLEELLQTADIISLHVPRNLEILTRKEFDLIKPDAVLVNTSIGKIFDLAIFEEWIKKGNNFAIIDNQDYVNQIKDLPNVIALAITAGKTKESVDRLGNKVIDNLKSFLKDH